MNHPSNNPLLGRDGLPRFALIEPRHVEPALDVMLAAGRSRIETLERQTGPVTFEGFVQFLEDLEEELARFWSPVSHLNAVKDSEELRRVYERCIPKLTAFHTEAGHNERLFNRFRQLHDSAAFEALGTAPRKVVTNALRDFRLAGVALPEREKARSKEIHKRLAVLADKFDQNVLDATQGWHLHVEDQGMVSGLPDSVIELAAAAARAKGLEGWVFDLTFPSYVPFMTYCEDRVLRQRMHEAFSTRASEVGPDAGRFDNSLVMSELLDLRREEATMLGFDHFASLSLETKMAESAAQVENFLTELAQRSQQAARRELEEVMAFSRETLGLESMEAWDLAFASEKLRQSLYEFTDEDIRPYFPEDRVVNGLFELVRRLFGLEIRERAGVEVWDQSVRFYDVLDADGTLRGGFYLDPYVRQGKRSGAWMDVCVPRAVKAGGVQTPVAYLICNFSPPTALRPALLTHEEVLTLFHEFGHGLHHMLTLVDYPSVSGINGVAWDAIELPSQIMENWCWEAQALELMSGHYETGEALPEALLEKMRSAKNFQSAMQMLRQVEFALFDLRLYSNPDQQNADAILSLLQRVRDEVAVFHPPAYSRFPHSFSHIFAGGYAAGYYGYKWAEVLSADAFSRFEEEGILNRNTGRDFMQHILERGGTEDAGDLFVKFRGRAPKIDALLRHCGLSD